MLVSQGAAYSALRISSVQFTICRGNEAIHRYSTRNYGLKLAEINVNTSTLVRHKRKVYLDQCIFIYDRLKNNSFCQFLLYVQVYSLWVAVQYLGLTIIRERTFIPVIKTWNWLWSWSRSNLLRLWMSWSQDHVNCTRKDLILVFFLKSFVS